MRKFFLWAKMVSGTALLLLATAGNAKEPVRPPGRLEDGARSIAAGTARGEKAGLSADPLAKKEKKEEEEAEEESNGEEKKPKKEKKSKEEKQERTKKPKKKEESPAESPGAIDTSGGAPGTKPLPGESEPTQYTGKKRKRGEEVAPPPQAAPPSYIRPYYYYYDYRSPYCPYCGYYHYYWQPHGYAWWYWHDPWYGQPAPRVTNQRYYYEDDEGEAWDDEEEGRRPVPSGQDLSLLIDPRRAMALSLACPGLGQFYAGRPEKGIGFLALEAFFFTEVIFSYVRAVNYAEYYQTYHSSYFYDPYTSSWMTGNDALGLAETYSWQGTFFLATSVVVHLWNIADAGQCARRTNRRFRRAYSLDLTREGATTYAVLNLRF